MSCFNSGIILGSSLGHVADEIEDKIIIDYSDIPNFKTSTAPGHKGRLVCGKLSGKNVVCMQGRLHYYEGYSAQDIAYPVKVMKLLGVKKLILTNAAGGINESFKAGDFMVIKDHINLTGTNPLIGKNDERFGCRFPDMTKVYSKDLIDAAEKAAEEIDNNKVVDVEPIEVNEDEGKKDESKENAANQGNEEGKSGGNDDYGESEENG